MRAERHLERVIGRITNESRLVGLHEEESLVPVHEADAEPFVDAGLARKSSVVVRGGLEGIVGRSDVVRESRRRKLGVLPVVRAKRFGQFLAVKSDLPWKQPVGFDGSLAVFRNGIRVGAGIAANGNWP